MHRTAFSLLTRALLAWLFAPSIFLSQQSIAASLPKEKAEVSTHYYSGDDTTVASSQVLVRKHVSNRYGLSLSQIIDSTHDGSTDVKTQASVDEYSEKRNATSLGLDILNNGTLILLQTGYSDEDDLRASTLHIDISQEMFGSSSTFGFGFSRGWDVVGRVDTQTEQNLDRQNLRLNFSQAMSQYWLSQFHYEHISEQGPLGNQYLAAMQQGALVAQQLPETRIQHSFTFSNSLYMQPKSVAVLKYRYFTDSWDMTSHTFLITHIQPINPMWEIDLHYRYYLQSEASFFNNNADQSTLYLTRDKNFSQFKQHTFGLIASYDWGRKLEGAFKDVSLNTSLDLMRFTYHDYIELGSDDAYQFSAYRVQFYLSWPF